MLSLMNEEEVKTKVVLPLLAKYGIGPDEISLEQSFNLKVGRYTLRVDTGKQIETAQPRLDLLISRSGKNLCIIEVKTQGHKLTEEDRDQAISYARLVHPIAPYAVTTNGREAQIYDTISKRLLTAADLKLAGGFEVTLPEDLQYETLKLFFGYSINNLLAFCSAQSAINLRPLIGSKQDQAKKYIPELHTPRQSLLQSVGSFLSSSDPLFVVLAASGMGKTSSLCHLVYHLLSQGEAVLFFQGLTLRTDLLEEIGHEFNWSFAEAGSSSISVLKRVESVLGGRQLVVVVDAIDEWVHPQKVQSLARLATHLNGSPLKLILSCKLNTWSQFVEQRGTPTGIVECVYHDPGDHTPHTGSDRVPGYYLQPWDGREFHDTLERYRKFYSFQGYFEDKALQEARRNPFFLRVFFEVAESSKLEHLTLSAREFFEAYYEKLTRKTGDQELARKQLRAVAEVLFLANIDAMAIDELERKIGLGLDRSLMGDLFAHNILERAHTNGTEYVRFSFQGLRDYLIVFHVLKWHEASIEEFSRSVADLQKEGVHQEVLQLFYRQGYTEKNRLLDSELRLRAERYLDFYNTVLHEHFPILQCRFSPCSQGKIGFIATINLTDQCFFHYGFRELRNVVDERVLFLPVDSPWETNLPDLYGAYSLHATPFAWDYKKRDVIEEVLNSEIVPQLETIIGRGLLDESVSEEMASEMIVALVKQHRDLFWSIWKPRGSMNPFPVVFEELRECFRRKKLRDHFENERIEYKRRLGELNEHWQGDTYGYSCEYTYADIRWIEEQVEAAMAKGDVIQQEERRYPLAKIEERVEACIRTLGPGTVSIQEPVFREPHLPERQRENRAPSEILNHAARVLTLFF